nr:dynein light chain [Hymenolepis microstoma]
MSDVMQQFAAEITAEAGTRYNNYIDISKYIKETFEKKYGDFWQCIVGKSFSCYVSYVGEDYIFFRLDDLFVMLYRIK